jgi:hypothetical protein
MVHPEAGNLAWSYGFVLFPDVEVNALWYA